MLDASADPARQAGQLPDLRNAADPRRCRRRQRRRRAFASAIGRRARHGACRNDAGRAPDADTTAPGSRQDPVQRVVARHDHRPRRRLCRASLRRLHRRRYPGRRPPGRDLQPRADRRPAGAAHRPAGQPGGPGGGDGPVDAAEAAALGNHRCAGEDAGGKEADRGSRDAVLAHLGNGDREEHHRKQCVQGGRCPLSRRQPRHGLGVRRRLRGRSALDTLRPEGRADLRSAARQDRRRPRDVRPADRGRADPHDPHPHSCREPGPCAQTRDVRQRIDPIRARRRRRRRADWRRRDVFLPHASAGAQSGARPMPELRHAAGRNPRSPARSCRRACGA